MNVKKIEKQSESLLKLIKWLREKATLLCLHFYPKVNFDLK